MVRSAPVARRRDVPDHRRHTQQIASDYGVLAADGSALRATFIIDPHGVVRYATVSDQNVGRSPHETPRVLQALWTGALCPVSCRKGEPTLRAA